MEAYSDEWTRNVEFRDHIPGMNPAWVKKIHEKRRLQSEQRKKADFKAGVQELQRKEMIRLRMEKLRRDEACEVLRLPPSVGKITNATLEKLGVYKPRPSAHSIMALVAEKHGVTVRALKGSAKGRDISKARHEAMSEVYVERDDLSLPQIGRLFGGRDHTTVLHAVRKTGVWRGKKSS